MTTQLFYISKPVFSSDHSVNDDILRVAKRNNKHFAITGFLFRTERRYFQLLEGAEGDVQRLMCKIRQDPRHYDLVEWPPETVSVRIFPMWTMGYATGRDAGLLETLPAPDVPVETLAQHLNALATTATGIAL